MKNNLECPVDFVSVNENVVRLTAFFVFLLSVLYLFIPHWIIAGFLALDFFLRGFNYGEYSLLRWVSSLLVKKLLLPNKPVDRGAKVFAAKIGFVIADVLLILSIFGLYKPGFYVGVILVIFSFLESAIGFCAGCYAYSFYKKFTRSAKAK